MSGRGYAERNLPSFSGNSFGASDRFKVDCRAEELAQELHLVILMKDTGLEKDSPASSLPTEGKSQTLVGAIPYCGEHPGPRFEDKF